MDPLNVNALCSSIPIDPHYYISIVLANIRLLFFHVIKFLTDVGKLSKIIIASTILHISIRNFYILEYLLASDDSKPQRNEKFFEQKLITIKKLTWWNWYTKNIKYIIMCTRQLKKEAADVIDGAADVVVWAIEPADLKLSPVETPEV